MGARRLLALLLATFTLTLTVSCGSKTAIDGVNNIPGTPGPDVAGLPSIPLDSGPRVVSEGGSGSMSLLGSEFIQKFNAEVDGTNLMLDATGEGEHFSYGMYQFGELAGSRPETLSVECLPEQLEQEYFVAIADYTENEWAWFGPSTFPEFQVDLRNDDHRFVTQTGNLYFLVVCREGQAAALSLSTLLFSEEREDDAPGAPHGLVATDGAFPAAVVIEWAPGAGANAYELFRRVDGSNMEFALIGTTENTRFEDGEVEPGVVYVYKARSVRGEKRSTFSNGDGGYAGELHHDDDCPTALFATDGSYTDKVRLEWTFQGEGFSGFFDVFRKLHESEGDFEFLGSVQGNSYNDFDVEAGVHYDYKVGIEREGSICYSPVDTGYAGEGGGGDGCPGDLFATDGTRTDGVMVEWAGGADATYDLYRRTGDGEYSLRDTVVGNHFLDADTVAGVNYFYKVFLHGHDCHSNEDLGTRGQGGGGEENCPTELWASDGAHPTWIVAEWNGNADATYKVYRRKDGTEGFLFRADVTGLRYEDDDVDVGAVYFYKIVYNHEGTECVSNVDSGFAGEGSAP